MQQDYYAKYLKYKSKYLELKNQMGGNDEFFLNDHECEILEQTDRHPYTNKVKKTCGDEYKVHQVFGMLKSFELDETIDEKIKIKDKPLVTYKLFGIHPDEKTERQLISTFSGTFDNDGFFTISKRTGTYKYIKQKDDDKSEKKSRTIKIEGVQKSENSGNIRIDIRIYTPPRYIYIYTKFSKKKTDPTSTYKLNPLLIINLQQLRIKFENNISTVYIKKDTGNITLFQIEKENKKITFLDLENKPYIGDKYNEFRKDIKCYAYNIFEIVNEFTIKNYRLDEAIYFFGKINPKDSSDLVCVGVVKKYNNKGKVNYYYQQLQQKLSNFSCDINITPYSDGFLYTSINIINLVNESVCPR